MISSLTKPKTWPASTALWMLGFVLLTAFSSSPSERWGFFGHRRINRMAVFTLPTEMIGFYKRHIEYITEHAVDPDKRRYATKFEAVRHYIDIDKWGKYPFPEVPRDWADALAKYTDIYMVTAGGDTLHLAGDGITVLEGEQWQYRNPASQPAPVSQLPSARAYRRFFHESVLPRYYEDEWLLPCDTLSQLFGLPAGACRSAFGIDRFSEHGILPYHLLVMQRRLTEAFRQGSASAILRLSAEIGHYIGDASVPLHTTENYNGQLTNQTGIHAFWESRLPELFADKQYDFMVGKAEYIARPRDFFWNLVLESHLMLDSVLAIEKDLSRTFPPDRQFCYEERLDVLVRTQCREYAAAYHKRLDGQVEKRMRDAILAIGSAWFTAWVDAGQPNLLRLGLDNDKLAAKEKREQEELEAALKKGERKGREHE